MSEETEMGGGEGGGGGGIKQLPEPVTLSEAIAQRDAALVRPVA